MFTPPTYDGPPDSRLGRHRLRIPMDSFPKRTLPINDAIRTGLGLAAAPGSPQVQTLPSSRLALHTCRAHMGVWQSMQRQRQWLGVRPHNPPPSLTWGHWGPTCCAGCVSWRLTILAREGLVTPSRRVRLVKGKLVYLASGTGVFTARRRGGQRGCAAARPRQVFCVAAVRTAQPWCLAQCGPR